MGQEDEIRIKTNEVKSVTKSAMAAQKASLARPSFYLEPNVQVIQGELNVSFQCQPWKPDSKESSSKHEFRGQG